MPLHNAKCAGCGWKGEVFFMPKAGIESVACEACGEKALQVDWNGPVRSQWQRTWTEESGLSTQHKCRPENVAAVRRRLAACGLDDAHHVVRDDGRFVFTDRSMSRRTNQAIQRCVEQDRADKARLGIEERSAWPD